MVNDALELIKVFEVRDVSLAGEPCSHNQVLALGQSPIFGLDMPFALASVKLSTNHNCLKGAVLAQIEDAIHMIEIGTKLFVGGVIGRPIPIFVRLRPGELVLGYF